MAIGTSSAGCCLVAGGAFCDSRGIWPDSHARLLHPHARGERHGHAWCRAPDCRPDAAGGLHADYGEAADHRPAHLLHQPHGHARAGQGGARARRAAAARHRRTNHRSPDHQHAAHVDGALVLARRAAQSVRRRRARRHLQLPDGDGAGRARRGRCRDDRGLGRRRHVDRAAAGALHLTQGRGGQARSSGPACRCRGRCRHRRLLVYGTFGLPAFSDPQAPIHTARRAALPQRVAARDGRAERRDVRAGELSRLRHARAKPPSCSPRASGSSRCCAAGAARERKQR